jgi:hypothetical protein
MREVKQHKVCEFDSLKKVKRSKEIRRRDVHMILRVSMKSIYFGAYER